MTVSLPVLTRSWMNSDRKRATWWISVNRRARGVKNLQTNWIYSPLKRESLWLLLPRMVSTEQGRNSVILSPVPPLILKLELGEARVNTHDTRRHVCVPATSYFIRKSLRGCRWENTRVVGALQFKYVHRWSRRQQCWNSQVSVSNTFKCPRPE